MYWITGIMGVVAIVAPYLFNFSDNLSALWTSLIIGAVLVVASVLEGLEKDKDTLEYWVAAVAGVAAILAPFVLNFGSLTEAVWTLVIVGGISVIAAGARLLPGQT